jgi:hypothetical protein
VTRHTHHIVAALLTVALAGVAAACGSNTPTSGLESPVVASPRATAGASATVGTSPSPTAAATPTPTATSAPTAADACPVPAETGRVPSDRLVDVRIAESDTADLITFVFDDPSLPGPPQGPSSGTLEAAEPPFTEGASGQPIDLQGEHAAIVRFDRMSIQNDIGEQTYVGATEFTPALPALQHLINYDMFEGVIGWYVGYDGPGCLTLTTNGNNVTLAIEHG